MFPKGGCHRGAVPRELDQTLLFFGFRKAVVIAVQFRVNSTKRAFFLHGLTARTDGPSVVFFFHSPVCKACGKEFVNRTKLHNHNCQRMLELAAQTGSGIEESSG